VGIDYVMITRREVLASLSPLVLLFQKYLVKGLTARAIKGK
jgi:ABC-type maltose transport system permease subunit